MARSTLTAWILRVSFALMVIAVGATALQYGNPISSTLFIDWDLDEATADTATHTWAYLTIASGLTGLHPRAWFAHLATAFLMALLIGANVIQREVLPLLIPFSQTSRFLAPVALALLLARPARAGTALVLLRICAAATFTGHGLRALHHDANFADLIFAPAQNIFDLSLDQTSVEAALTIIGTSDLLLALLCLTGRFRWPLVLMTGWGLITATSRILHGGLEAWPLTVERIPNAGVPLSILLFGVPASSQPNVSAD